MTVQSCRHADTSLSPHPSYNPNPNVDLMTFGLTHAHRTISLSTMVLIAQTVSLLKRGHGNTQTPTHELRYI